MINEAKIKKIQAKLRKAVAQIEKDENIKIEFGGARYNSAYYTCPIKVITLEKNEKVDSVFETLCKSFGFTQNIIGMKFNGLNGVYEITDINTRARKYHVIAKSLSTGKSYKYTVAQIKKLIGGDKVINRNANLNKLVK